MWMGRGSEDAEQLSEGVVAALPADPFEQLEVARKIVGKAVAEGGSLKQRLREKDDTISTLEQHISELHKSLREATTKLSQALDEQVRLINEKNILVATVKRLNRDSAKRDDSEKALRRLSLHTSLASVNSNLDLDTISNRCTTTNSGGNTTSVRPFDTTRLPTQSSSDFTVSSLSQEEHHPSADGDTPSSPRWHSTTEPRVSFRLPRSSASHHNTSPNSSPLASNTPAFGDGKELFRQARNRLPYDQFSAFLVNIKDLNAHRQTKEEVLRKAYEILGPENTDLFTNFEGLLACHFTCGV